MMLYFSFSAFYVFQNIKGCKRDGKMHMVTAEKARHMYMRMHTLVFSPSHPTAYIREKGRFTRTSADEIL